MLIDCPECGGKISDKCVFCVHCGYPYRELHQNDSLPTKTGTPKKTVVDSESTINKIKQLKPIGDVDKAFAIVMMNKTKEYPNSSTMPDEELTRWDDLTGVPRDIWTYMYDNNKIPKNSSNVQSTRNIDEDLDKLIKERAEAQRKAEEKSNNIKGNPLQPKTINDTSSLPVRHQLPQSPSYGVKCPYCGSSGVKKIGTLGRATSIAVAGVASKKIGKQWHCNKCGSDF